MLPSTESNVQNKMTELPLRWGASSWTAAQVATVPAQRTGTQPCTLQFRSLCFNPSLKAHPRPCWRAGKEPRHPHQSQFQGRSSSYPDLWVISRQRLIANRSQIPRRSDGHHGENQSAKIGSQLSSAVITEVPEKSLSHHSQEIANDLGPFFPPIVLQVATKKPS